MVIEWAVTFAKVNWTAVSAVGGAIGGSIGIYIALRNVRDQLQVAVFNEYTKRYADIIERLPFEARRPGAQFDPQKLDEAGRRDYLNAMRRYLNLCAEELYLKNGHRIDPKIWEIWKLGIEDTVSWPGFRYAWTELCDEYAAYRPFYEFIETALSASTSQPKSRAAGVGR